MRKTIFPALLLACLPAAAWSAETTAIVNVNVIPMTADILLPQQTVVISGDRIAAVGDVGEVAVPAGARVIDGTDRYLVPGLTEMHAHVTGTADRDVERLFNLFLANGVTTIRGMLGRPSHLALRDDILAGRVTGPRLITSGPSLNGNSVDGPADGVRQVREQQAAGYDFLKIHPGLSAPEFNAIADEANRLGMPFAGHVPVSVGLSGALAKGIATIDHLDGYMAALLPANVDPSGGYGGFFDVMLADDIDRDGIGALVDATVAAGVANVPTQTLFEFRVSSEAASDIANRPEMQYVTASTIGQWVSAKESLIRERGFNATVASTAISVRRELIKRLHDAGGLILLGSDAPQVFNVPGFSLHRELELMVASGLSPFDALRAGTTAPAEFFGLDAGTVETGRIADLMLLDANPLADIANSRRVHGVIVRGRWLRASDLLAAARPR